MRISELEPKWLARDDDTHWREVSKVGEADGVEFLCPKCLLNNNMNKVGVHSILCWGPNVPQSTSPRPGRWKIEGNSFESLTLIANSSSVKLSSGCGAHFFVANGGIVEAEPFREPQK